MWLESQEIPMCSGFLKDLEPIPKSIIFPNANGSEKQEIIISMVNGIKLRIIMGLSLMVNISKTFVRSE
ncbi:MAG: hypothetical protein A3J80_08525 [Desulfobacula sp. RIFOXYB2_FULL_45_6]|nr:MAG: hypothetical protein A3J80_08525 [Desulfobacula sp. RIFOXYB2_FULL_45_6]